MNKTYCGKSCEQCSEKFQGKCEDCTEGTKDAPFIAKWIMILFILSVINIGVGLIAVIIPSLKFLGNVVSLICTLSYGLVLLKLSSVHNNYQIAGICYIITNIFSFISSAFSTRNSLIITFSIISLIISIISIYNEIIAHSEIAGKHDYILASNWHNLWNLYKGILIAIAVAIVLIFIMPGLVSLALLGIAISLIIFSILKLVYLYKTAARFKAIS